MKPFARSIAIYAAISAIMAQGGVTYTEKIAQKAALTPYCSRGKGGRKSPHRQSGVRTVQRASIKARNVKHQKRFA